MGPRISKSSKTPGHQIMIRSPNDDNHPEALGEASSPATDSANLRLADAMEEYLNELNAGQRPDRSEFLQRFPDIADQLGRVLPGLEFVKSTGSELGHSPQAAPSEPIHPLATLGDFRIVREIGRGGMGVVYEAEQLSLGRSVALKVLPFAAMLDQRHLKRFKNEAHAAATLHHTNIVPVYAVGQERGVHYYAMQFIEGQTLEEIVADLRKMEGLDGKDDESDTGRSQLASDFASGKFASQRSPGPHDVTSDFSPETETDRPDADPAVTDAETKREVQASIATHQSTKSPAYFRSVAELAIQVAEALDHAHEAGVTHRDIKPSNLILDARGKVWITDFGLARLESDPGMTMTGDLVGTLRYMSPEQAMAQRVVIDHRTDVYSLGVTLYELLALRPAFSGDDRQELLRQIAFEEPRKLRRVNSSVPADLETIVLKATAKSANERYATAQDLADDLRRYLTDEPIKAKRPTLAQRTAKWSRRNKVLVGAAVVVLILTTLGLAISTVLISRERSLVDSQRQVAEGERDAARKARNEAQQARDEADEARQLAEQVTQFLIDAFRSADPTRDGHTITVAELLEQASKRAKEELTDEPLLMASLLAVAGQTYLGLGLPHEATEVLGVAHAIRCEHLGPGHLDTLEPTNDLARALDSLGRYDEAIEMFEETLISLRKAVGHEHECTLVTMNNLAAAYRSSGRCDKAIELHEETLKSMRKVLGSEHPDTLTSMNNLAECYMSVGRYDEAIEMFEETLKSQRKILGPEHPHMLTSMGNLATAYGSVGRCDEALELIEETLQLSQNVYGPEHPNTLASMANLAMVYQNGGYYDEAVERYEATLQLRRQILGPDHHDTLTSACNLAQAYRFVRRYDEAVELHEETLKSQRKILGPEHPKTLKSVNNLAEAYRSVGRYDEAIELLGGTLQCQRKILGPDHPDTLTSVNNLALAYGSVGRYYEAVDLFEETLKGQPDVFGPDHPETLAFMNNLASAYRLVGRYGEAIELSEKTLELSRKVLGPEHTHTLNYTNTLAQAYRSAGRNGDALNRFEELLTINRRIHGSDHPSTLFSMANLAASYVSAGRHEEAIKINQENLQLKRGVLGAEDPSTLTTMDNLACALSCGGRGDEAIELFVETLRLKRKVLGSEHPATLRSMQNLAAAYHNRGRFDRAIEMHEETLKSQRKIFGPEHPDTLTSVNNLAAAYRSAGRNDEAVELFVETLRLRRKVFGSEHPATLATMRILATLYLTQGRLTEAELLARECLDARQKNTPDGWQRYDAMSLLGATLSAQGKYTEAEPLLFDGHEGIIDRRAKNPAYRKARIVAIERIIHLYEAWEKPDKATEWKKKLEAFEQKQEAGPDESKPAEKEK